MSIFSLTLLISGFFLMKVEAEQAVWLNVALRDAICEHVDQQTLQSIMLANRASFGTGTRALWGRFGKRAVADIDGLLASVKNAVCSSSVL